MQDDAVSILQRDTTGTARQRGADTKRAVGTGDIAGASKVQCRAYKFSGRPANSRAKARSRNPEGITLTVVRQYTSAATDTDNKACFGEYDGHPACPRLGWRCHTRRE